jgi:hypothetical protein
MQYVTVSTLNSLLFCVQNLPKNGLRSMLTARLANIGYVNFVGFVRSQN